MQEDHDQTVMKDSCMAAMPSACKTLSNLLGLQVSSSPKVMLHWLAVESAISIEL